MLKLYRPEGSIYIGQDVTSWDRTWSEHSVGEAVRWAAACYLTPIFDRYFPPGGKILEGGCGLGQYVIHYRARGYDIEGVDFSPTAVRQLKAFDPSLPVQLADICRLPYDDGAIDCYYSGGVVEHFEEGPELALAEARRVLAPDGRLLITVPYANWIRRGQAALGIRRRHWDQDDVLLVPRERPGVEPVPRPGVVFAEYVFARAEFEQYLTAAGFQVESAAGCDVEWGEVGQALCHLMRSATAARDVSEGVRPESRASAGLRQRAVALYKEIFVSEHPRQAWLRASTRALATVAGHMLLVVARPRRHKWARA